MKNTQSGFIAPILLVVIALLVIGGGVYVYENKKVEAPAVVNTETQESNQQQTSVKNVPSSQQTTSGFVKYFSPLGFQLSLPEGWVVKTRKGDAKLIGDQWFLPKEMETVYNQYIAGPEGDVQNYFRVRILASPKVSTAKEIPTSLYSEKDNVITEKNIVINGNNAYEVISGGEGGRGNFKQYTVFLLVNPKETANSTFSYVVIMEYLDRDITFDQSLAEKIAYSFVENIPQEMSNKNSPVSGAVLKDSDENIKTQLWMISNYAELALYKAGSFANLCSGEYINLSFDKSIKDSVEKIIAAEKVSSQKDLGIRCFSSGKKYAISIPLKASSEWWCIDSSGLKSAGVANGNTFTCQEK
jgi:hypothetical protein